MAGRKPIPIGVQFGDWLVVKAVHVAYSGQLRHMALCLCKCGTERLVNPTYLRSGKAVRCQDCASREKRRTTPALTHGGYYTRLYGIWSKMRARCSNPSLPDFQRYGRRGIAVCDAWQDFASFRTWAEANGYRDDLTIDRRDNDRGYEPENCRWATLTQQARNKRNTKRYTFNGELLLLSEISERTGFPLPLLAQRVRRDGLDVERALSTPKRKWPPQSSMGE